MWYPQTRSRNLTFAQGALKAKACSSHSSQAKHKGITNVSFAAHRFETMYKPALKMLLQLDAWIMLAEQVTRQRSQQDAGHQCAIAFKELLGEEALLCLAMAVDASDTVTALTRFFDTESYDIAGKTRQCTLTATTLQHLFSQGNCIHNGATAHVRAWLENPHMILRNNAPVVLGGQCEVTQRAVEKCLSHFRAYTRLALATMRAEFPTFEVLECFSLLDLGKSPLVRLLKV